MKILKKWNRRREPRRVLYKLSDTKMDNTELRVSVVSSMNVTPSHHVMVMDAHVCYLTENRQPEALTLAKCVSEIPCDPWETFQCVSRSLRASLQIAAWETSRVKKQKYKTVRNLSRPPKMER